MSFQKVFNANTICVRQAKNVAYSVAASFSFILNFLFFLHCRVLYARGAGIVGQSQVPASITAIPQTCFVVFCFYHSVIQPLSFSVVVGFIFSKLSFYF